MRAILSPSAWLPWRRAGTTPAIERNGPRIAVIGNCQARVVAQAMRVLAPRAAVTLVPMGRLGKDHATLADLARSLDRYDHVFSQNFGRGFFRDGGAEELAAALPRARLFPAIVFPAFHPDAIYVGDLGTMASARLVPSPLHTYHSAIVLFGFLRGLDAARIVGLFRQEVFARLGYLDLWAPAAEDLLASSRAVGFDLAADLVRWSRAGIFMHTINHPKLFVLGDIAARLLREARLAPLPLPIESYVADELLDDVIWPIYEPVADLYGVAGSYLFKRRSKRGEPPALLDLETFVAESLALYARLPAERLRSHRTEHWAGNPAIAALFDAA